MHDLALDVLGHAFLTEPCRVLPCRLALEDQDLQCTEHLPVNVGEHPKMRRMLQHRIDAADPVAGPLGVVGRHDGLKQRPPVHLAGFVVVISLGRLASRPVFSIQSSSAAL